MNAFPHGEKSIREAGIVKQFKVGETILQEQSKVRSIPFIIQGRVKVMQSDDDYREMLLYYLQPGETCIMSLLGGLFDSPAHVKAVAEEDTEVVFISVNEFQELVKEDPQWLNYIFKVYHQRYTELLEVVNHIAFKKMDERILQFLQKKSKVSGSNELSITHEQIAQELGTAREVISRLLKQMEVEGLVELERNKVILM